MERLAARERKRERERKRKGESIDEGRRQGGGQGIESSLYLIQRSDKRHWSQNVFMSSFKELSDTAVSPGDRELAVFDREQIQRAARIVDEGRGGGG